MLARLPGTTAERCLTSSVVLHAASAVLLSVTGCSSPEAGGSRTRWRPSGSGPRPIRRCRRRAAWPSSGTRSPCRARASPSGRSPHDHPTDRARHHRARRRAGGAGGRACPVPRSRPPAAVGRQRRRPLPPPVPLLLGVRRVARRAERGAADRVRPCPGAVCPAAEGDRLRDAAARRVRGGRGRLPDDPRGGRHGDGQGGGGVAPPAVDVPAPPR